MTPRKTKKFEAKERIITKGQKAVTAYLITKGMVRVYLEQHGRMVTLAELGPGSIFGESALFGGDVYGANVTAIEDTEVTTITPESFEKKVAACDPMIKAMILMSIERLRKTNEKLLKVETQEFMDIGFV
jgi:CRP-like cAMP-binding protein